jgi:hypothetical protein
MAATKYSYLITSAFPNQKVNSDSLRDEIEASAILTALDAININPEDESGYCAIWFVDALSGGDETLLNGIVAAHQGEPPVTVQFQAPSKLIMDSKVVTEDQTWETMGGTVTNLQAFMPDVTKAWGRLVGQCLVVGTGAQLRVIRDSDDAVCGGPFSVADSAGAWAFLNDWVNQNQPEGYDCYLLQARLNGATSMEMRYFTVSLFQKSP